jgi:hypothetical protein
MFAQPTNTTTATTTTTTTTTIHTTSTYDDKIGPFDVLCGRDKSCYNNVGNRRFRVLISLNLHRYLNCESRFDRSTMILSLSQELCESGTCSVRFFKRKNNKGAVTDDDDDSSSFIELDDKQIREKVGHALRDAASQRNSNSNSNSNSNKSKSKEMIAFKSKEFNATASPLISITNNNDPAPRRLSMFLLQEHENEDETDNNDDGQENQSNMPFRLSDIFNEDYNEPNIVHHTKHHQSQQQQYFSEGRRSSCAPITFQHNIDFIAPISGF